MSTKLLPPEKDEGPAARQRSGPSGTATTHTHCPAIDVVNQVIISTDNPRNRRALSALLAAPLSRKQLDQTVGCSNSPDLVRKLRLLSLVIPCVRQPVVDCDGNKTWYGIYSLTAGDKALVRAALKPGRRS